MIPLPFRASALGGLLLLAVAGPAVGKVRVEITGLSGNELANVEARLSIKAQAGEKGLDDNDVKRLHEQAAADIREALQPFGYYSPKIESDLGGRAPDWVASYAVEAGPETQIVSIDLAFVGEGREELQKLHPKRAIIEVGERIRHAQYENVKKRMMDQALNHGYIDAHWKTAELRIDVEKREARIVLHLETGPRFYFGPVTIEQSVIDPAVVARYVNLEVGAPFETQKLLDLQFVLGDLGYFDYVAIEPQRDLTLPGNRIPILLRATPRARTRWDFGVGYGTDTGARVSMGSEWRRLNDKGHTLQTDFRLSQIKNTLQAEYRIPQGTTPGEYLGFTAAYESEELEDGETFKYLIGTSINRAPEDAWQKKYYLEFAHEETDFGETFVTADLLTPGIQLTRTAANDPIYARRGWYLFADLHGAARNVLSSTSFVQGHVLGRGIYPLGQRLRLLTRAEFGYSIVEEFGELPASERFFAGGDQSVRGYAYQSIGPKDEEGDVVGGKYLTTYSVEVEMRLGRMWGIAGFIDAGGADDDPNPSLFKGIGAGLRYRAPIGSLQLDLAHPLDGDESPVRVHIGVRVGV
ncbi:MAG TPA: autotransporter assembly complex family protein [Nevskiaceae bacterium]|nr:autotransporter assembly complex family protein [Nevskiaceae bacterium]